MTGRTVMMSLVTACTLSSAAVAAGAFDGRWGAACDVGPMLVVSSTSLRWREATCAIRNSYRVRDAWHIAARCLAEGVTAEVPIKLELRSGRIVLEWAGAPAEELRRCP